MNYNENYFNCSFYKNQYVENPCKLKLGYTENFYGILTLIIISILGIILNIIFLFLNCLKRKKRKGHKALMRRIFLIFPFTDIFTSIYWLVSVIQFSDLERIKQNITLCSVNSLFYIFLITFQFILINILLYHFRKINKNPLDAIYKQNTKLILYLIICFILGFIVSLLAERFQLIGISPMNTCFISVKSGLKNLIFLIPLICMIIAIIQLIHDIFFIYMFNSDKAIRSIYKKNSLYVFIFCLLHIPLILVMIFSFIIRKNYFEIKENIIVYYFIKISTEITCIIPFVMSIVRQIQGITRLECINNCIKKRASMKLRKTIESYKNLNTNIKESTMIDIDPFEWIENHIIENFIRDILFGVAACIKSSKVYDNNIINEELNNKIKFENEDFEEDKIFEINFKNLNNYNINDITVENSDYLNIKIIDYAPKCFHHLRKIEKIDIDEMVESFLPKNNSRRIKESLGKSGSFFISTDDNKYMIKTLKSEELELLRHTFLKEYITHIEQNPKSLLCRIYGMYNVIFAQGKEILIIVMRNVIGDFKDNTIIKYDLKGSTYKRTAAFHFENDNNVMKDLDFMEFEKSIMLSKQSINKLRQTAEKDSNFLKNSELMDYSLFLAKITLNKEEEEDVFGKNIRQRKNADLMQLIAEQKENKKKNLLYASYRGYGKVHDVEQYRQYLYPSLTQGTGYIIAIIDYFQNFNFFKFMESSLKNKLHRKNTISCVDPETYSKRFINNIYALTDEKQSLSYLIQEEEKIVEERDEENSEDDEDNIILIGKRNKELITESQMPNNEQLLIQSQISST